MNRNDARTLADIVTNEQLKQMFDNAKGGIKDWTKVSSCNIGFTKGVAWNILAKDFDVNCKYHIISKTNMIREFGEFLPSELKQKVTRQKKSFGKPVHHDPIF
jgi:hypothetical protein